MFKSRRHLLAVVASVSLVLVFTSGCNRDPNVRKRKYLESGKRYETAGKYKEAVIQFSNALKVDKNYGDAHYELGKTYLKLGALRVAYGELSRAVELSPTNLPARVNLAQLYLAGNAPDKAEEQANAVLTANANSADAADAYAVLAGVAGRRGDHLGALTNIQKALAIKPNEAVFHTTLALIENSDPQGEPAAETELRKAISLDAKDTHAHMVLAALLEKKGDKSGAEQEYLAAIQTSPKDIHPRASLAGLYLRSQDKAKTEQTLRKAVEDNPDSDEAAELLKDYYFRTAQADAAEGAFADLNSKYPKSFPIKMMYASILAAKGQYAKVAPITDELVKMNPHNARVLVLQSALLINGGKLSDAFDLLQKGVKNDPQDEPLQLALARVSEMKGDLATATSSFRAAEKLAPQSLEIQAGLAQLAARTGDASMLSQIADKAISINPNFPQAYLWRGMAESSEKLYDKADIDLQMAATKAPNNAAVFTALGQLRLRQGKIAEATPLLEKALDKDPNEVTALANIVSIDLNAKQPDKAIARAQQQIAKSPKNHAMYSLLAQIQLSQRDFNGARDNSKKAMDLDPTDEIAVQTYAQAAGALGNTDEAISTWQKWVGTHPKDAGAVTTIAMLEDAKGDHAKATEDYKKALQIDPGQGQAANNLAYQMLTTGQNVDVALSYAQTARRALPNSPDTADTLAWVYYYKGTYLSARDLLEDALKKNPDNASIQYHLGMTYSKLGKKPDAQLHLKKAVTLDPTGQTGKDAAAELARLG